jgi:hypothetical protein
MEHGTHSKISEMGKALALVQGWNWIFTQLGKKGKNGHNVFFQNLIAN